MFSMASSGAIFDMKLVQGPRFINAPVGVFVKSHQDLRIWILDPFNKWMGPFSLGAGYDVTTSKNQDGTYQNDLN
jgi:hypothetical protein